MNIKIKIAGAIAAGALFAATMMPGLASAATTIHVNGNGAGSTNKVVTVNKQNSKITQSNSTAVLNLTGVFQNTGGNHANGNTGGTVGVTSGTATSTVSNTTHTGGNSATVDPCGCPVGDTTIHVIDNGADSTNTVVTINTSSSKVIQSNETLVVNGTLVDQDTGGNHANNNTGSGVTVDSGNASSGVTNDTTTGGNTLNP